ncbi:MAG: hypothetical protein Q7S58_10375 [Candidatus Binatus sp.]|nr:hypothetical protein [Candidatus Binatus sp.]MDO8432798.1 hypothetical protein [Candidatus Binatus sp.]
MRGGDVLGVCRVALDRDRDSAGAADFVHDFVDDIGAARHQCDLVTFGEAATQRRA